MNRTIKRFHYDDHAQLKKHLADFIDAYNFGRRLKRPYEFICKRWTSELERFSLNPIHQMPGLNASSLAQKQNGPPDRRRLPVHRRDRHRAEARRSSMRCLIQRCRPGQSTARRNTASLPDPPRRIAAVWRRDRLRSQSKIVAKWTRTNSKRRRPGSQNQLEWSSHVLLSKV
jgi:hypothetical protein